MNWEIVGAVGELIGGLAVILSILYLAYQVRESRVQAIAESERDMLNTSNLWSHFVSIPDATQIYRNGLNNYESLDPDSQARFTHLVWPIFNQAESVHHMRQKGLLGESTYDRWMSGVVGTVNTSGGAAWWSRMRIMFSEEFVEEVERLRDSSDLVYKITDTWNFYNEDSFNKSP